MAEVLHEGHVFGYHDVRGSKRKYPMRDSQVRHSFRSLTARSKIGYFHESPRGPTLFLNCLNVLSVVCVKFI